MLMRSLAVGSLLVGFVFGCAACSGDDSTSSDGNTKGDEDNVPADGKADSFFNPTEHGDLSFGVPAQGTFTEDEHFHAWTFALSAQADVSLSSPNVTPNLDTVMYLYRRDPGATSWGRYIQRNDDFDGNIWSKISKTLDAGEYRVIVKAYKTALTGTFQLDGTCEGDGCPGASSGDCQPEDVEPEVTTTDVTQTCVNTYAAVLSSPLLSESKYHIEYPQHCSLTGPERVAVEQYYAYWQGLVGWSDLLFEEGEIVSFDVTAQKLERGWVVDVDYGADEMALMFVFDEKDDLVMFYHSEQSPSAYWICNDDGPAIDEPDLDCVSGAIYEMPHESKDETDSSATTSVADARAAMSFLGGFALDEYQTSTGISDDSMVTYRVREWVPSQYSTVATVVLEAAGQPATTYAVGGTETYAHIYWQQIGADTEMICRQVGN